jgi:hypothetical protein
VSTSKHVIHRSGTTTTETVTSTPTYHLPLERFVHALAPGARPQRGEVERRCPYIRTGLNMDPTSAPNVADIEGSRIYRTTVLHTLHPVGCRFYFYAPPYEAIADIVPRTFPTAEDAHNALAITAARGRQPITKRAFVPGVDGVLYRTKFFADDGGRDWAFAFAKGRVLVIVHTHRTDSSLNAFLLGKAVVGRF